MRRIIFIGKSGAGKTTLTQTMKNKPVEYHKTQYVNYHDVIIDTPGEYAQSRRFSKALALYTYEADVVGILCAANEPYSLFPGGVAAQANRECIGIVTKIDLPDANVPLADRWLENAGVSRIFHVNSLKGEGVQEILDYLLAEDDEEQ